MSRIEVLRAVTARCDPALLFEQIEQSGAVVVEAFLAADLLGRLRQDLEPTLASWTPGSRSEQAVWRLVHGARTKRFCGLCGRSPAFVELLLDPLLKEYADHFLLSACGSYWLNTAQVVAIGPGERAQMLHRDEASWPEVDLGRREKLVGCMVALDDFTAENGATRVIPGSQRWPSERQPREEEAVPVVMTAGSALLYTGSVVHGGGENGTRSEWRRGLHVSFLLGWLRPEENHYLALSTNVVESLPGRARDLLGYASYHAGGLGGRLGLVDGEDVGLERED